MQGTHRNREALVVERPRRRQLRRRRVRGRQRRPHGKKTAARCMSGVAAQAIGRCRLDLCSTTFARMQVLRQLAE
jgi:hypothetical protein